MRTSPPISAEKDVSTPITREEAQKCSLSSGKTDFSSIGEDCLVCEGSKISTVEFEIIT